jgi:hypothetical protein
MKITLPKIKAPSYFQKKYRIKHCPDAWSWLEYQAHVWNWYWPFWIKIKQSHSLLIVEEWLATHLKNGVGKNVLWQSNSEPKTTIKTKDYKELISFIHEVATGYDCDSDSHKYKTRCRACEAQKLKEKFKMK